MNLKCLLLCAQLFVLAFTLAKGNENEFKVAYHVVCDEDHVVSLSYNLINGETEVYPHYLEMEDVAEADMGLEAHFFQGICANEGFKNQLTGYPLLPSLKHGYLMLGLKEDRQSSNPFPFSNPMIRKSDYDNWGKLRSNRMKKLRTIRMK